MNCPNCGKEIKPTDKFCIFCGNKIDKRNTASSTRGRLEETVHNVVSSLMRMKQDGINVMVRRYFWGFADAIIVPLLVFLISTVIALSCIGVDVIYRYEYGYGYESGFTRAVGIFFGILGLLAFVVLIVFIKEAIYVRESRDAEKKIDEVTKKYISMLKSRAVKKFNVDEDQLEEVAPVVIAGAGVPPSLYFTEMASNIQKIVGVSQKLKSKDPFEACRADKNGIPRYLLIQTTVYAFTDTQLLVYAGNVDISTGIVYDESVSEVFYTDVNSIVQKEVLKKFNNEYYTLKFLELDICGISKVAAFDSRLVGNINERLAGMESYIREKKNQAVAL